MRASVASRENSHKSRAQRGMLGGGKAPGVGVGLSVVLVQIGWESARAGQDSGPVRKLLLG